MFVWCLNFFVKFRFRAFFGTPCIHNIIFCPHQGIKGNGAGLAWESYSHCFADEFVIIHAHTHAVNWYRLITWLLSRKWQKNVVNREIIWTVKGTVSVISSVESPCTERNPDSQRYRWNLYLINNVKATVVFKC